MAWGAGLLGGPAIGGFVFERVGFARLTLLWAPLLLVVSARCWRGYNPASGPATAIDYGRSVAIRL